MPADAASDMQIVFDIERTKQMAASTANENSRYLAALSARLVVLRAALSAATRETAALRAEREAVMRAADVSYDEEEADYSVLGKLAACSTPTLAEAVHWARHLPERGWYTHVQRPGTVPSVTIRPSVDGAAHLLSSYDAQRVTLAAWRAAVVEYLAARDAVVVADGIDGTRGRIAALRDRRETALAALRRLAGGTPDA